MRRLVAHWAVVLGCVSCAADGASSATPHGDEPASSDGATANSDETSGGAPDRSSDAEQTSDRDGTGASPETTSEAHTEEPTTTGASEAPEPPAPSLDCQATGDNKTTLVFVNRCDGALTVRGSDMAEGQLLPGANLCRDIGTVTEELPAKRYWAFAGQDPGNEHYTLAEFTFNTDFNDFDWYNISHVDAFNLPMQIVPLDEPECKSLTCADDLLANCPAVGQDRDEAGDVVVCVSPDRDDGESEVALYFERCDDAYAWSGDDQQGNDPSPVAACAGEDWQITFCPE